MVPEHDDDHDFLGCDRFDRRQEIGRTPETLRLGVRWAEREGGRVDGAAPDPNAHAWAWRKAYLALAELGRRPN